MASFNKLTVIGELGRDAELVYTTSGAAMVKFPMASIERWTDITGFERQHTTWLHVQLWGQRAEGLCEILTKGSMVFVSGRLRIFERADRDGSRRALVELTASDVQVLESSTPT